MILCICELLCVITLHSAESSGSACTRAKGTGLTELELLVPDSCSVFLGAVVHDGLDVWAESLELGDPVCKCRQRPQHHEWAMHSLHPQVRQEPNGLDLHHMHTPKTTSGPKKACQACVCKSMKTSYNLGITLTRPPRTSQAREHIYMSYSDSGKVGLILLKLESLDGLNSAYTKEVNSLNDV